MPEMAKPGGQAGDAALVAEIKRLLIALAAAGVDDGADAGVDQDLRAVGEGEEGVAEGDGALDEWAGLLDGEAAGCQAIHLAGAGAEEAGDLGRGVDAADRHGVAGDGTGDDFHELSDAHDLGTRLGAGLANELAGSGEE